MAQGTERTIGQLVADATHDLQEIVRGEIDLAKAEIAAGAKVMGRGAGLLAGAGFLGLVGLFFLFHTFARVIAVWLPVWAGYAIVTAFLFIVAAVLGLLGRKALQEAKPAPERAIEQGKATVAVLKQDRSATNASAPTDATPDMPGTPSA
jgi:Na+-transporting methylmalonyl-CoA/oxaloacetate decarboxylase gamma subunit